MLGEAMVEGRFYAYREKRGVGQPILKVKLLEKLARKGKLQVRFVDGPHPGLEDYVNTRQIVVPWGERRAFLRDEERGLKLADHCRQVCDSVVAEAASKVLASSGEPSAAVGEDGYVYMDREELQRICDRAGLAQEPTRLHGLAFVDREDCIHLPFEAAVAVARAFAAAEPETVLMDIEDSEEQYKAEGYEPGQRYMHDLLRRYQPAWALARQWAGTEREVEMLQKEIGRLRALVSQAAYELKASGREHRARRLLRAVDGR